MAAITLHDGLLYVMVFGPGVGESIVIRSPSGTDRYSWIVVDSLKMGDISPAAAVLKDQDAAWSAVLLTHAHKDHAAGMSEVINSAGAGPIGCAEPLLEDLNPDEDSPDPERLRQRAAVLDTLAAIFRVWSENHLARWPLIQGASRQVGDVKLTSLWPNTSALNIFDRKHNPNRVSSPLLLEWRDCTLLLGADLPAQEWQEVGKVYANLGDHILFKLSHHSSKHSVSQAYAICTTGKSRHWVGTPFGPSGHPRFEGGEGPELLLKCVERLYFTGLATDHDLEGKVPYETTLADAQVGKRPKPVSEDLPGGITFRPIGKIDQPFVNFVAMGFDASGELKDVKYGHGAIIVNR